MERNDSLKNYKGPERHAFSLSLAALALWVIAFAVLSHLS